MSPVAPAWKRHSEPSSDEDGPKSTRTFDTELSTHSALHDQPYSLDAQLRAVMDEVTFPNGTLKATEALSVLEPLGSLYAPDVMNGSIESHQEVKEEEQPRQIYQFDLDAMLSDAMAKAASQVHTEQQSMSIAPSMLTLPPSTFNIVETMGGIKVKEEEIEDVHGDDKSDSPNFDLDAHLNVAMASNSHAMSEAATEPSSHEMSSDEDEGFDLDAQIGAAMGSLVPSLEGVATTTPAAALRAQKNPRGKGAGGGDAGGITADELQAMLRGAMQQATKELELDEEDYEDIDAEFLEGEVFSERPFVLPSKPRIRPSVEDDGNPENAFNRARPHHYQALPYAFACSFPKCDNVVSINSKGFYSSSYIRRICRLNFWLLCSFHGPITSGCIKPHTSATSHTSAQNVLSLSQQIKTSAFITELMIILAVGVIAVKDATTFFRRETCWTNMLRLILKTLAVRKGNTNLTLDHPRQSREDFGRQQTRRITKFLLKHYMSQRRRLIFDRRNSMQIDCSPPL